MWKKLKKAGLQDALDLVAAGKASRVRATAEYNGNEYLATFTPKGVAEPKPSHCYTMMRLSSELERLLFSDRLGAKTLHDQFPWLTLPPGFSFKVTFPFTGAAARFRIRKDDKPDRKVSVYLDTQHVLGYFGGLEEPEPYWEAYPINGDTARFAMHESDELIQAIVHELNGLNQTTDSINA